MAASAPTPSRDQRRRHAGRRYGADRIDGRGGNDIVDYSAFSTRPITAGVFVNLSTASQTTTGHGGVTTVTLAAGTARDSWGFIDSSAMNPAGISNLKAPSAPISPIP